MICTKCASVSSVLKLFPHDSTGFCRFARVLAPEGNSLIHSDNICLHLAKNVHKAPYGFTSLSDLAPYLSLLVCMWPTAPKKQNEGNKNSLIFAGSPQRYKDKEVKPLPGKFSKQKLFVFFYFVFFIFTAKITGSNMYFGKGGSSRDVSFGRVWKMLGVRTGKAHFVLLECDLPEGVRTKHRHDATRLYLSFATQLSR